MNLELHRIALRDTYTIGRLYVDGRYFCDTIEDKVRDIEKEGKIYGQTAIPYGTYLVRVTWSPKFKRLLPILKDVPYFEGIRIHRGNTAEDSLGCIIVGENKIKGKVINSTKYELKLTEMLKNSGEHWIKIT